MINPMELTGKKIILTGACGGIGQITAKRLSQLGASVILIDVQEEQLQNTMETLDGEGHSFYSLDFKNIESIESVIKQVHEDNGAVNGFVHCAGVAPMRPLKMTKYDHILQVMQINYFSFVEIVRCLAKKDYFSDGGSIVAMSSTGSINGKPTKTAYSSSKAAIDAAIRCMICDLKKRKIRINSVMPSWVNTRMYSSYVERYPDSSEMKEIEEKQYMGVSDPEEIANVISFLLSDATKTITGSSILMDGGILQG